MRIVLIKIASLIVIVGLSVPFFFAYPEDIRFNQYEISGSDIWNTVRSRYSLGINNLFLDSDKSVSYSHPKDFFSYIFKKLPTFAVVYPTETYYYYNVRMPSGVEISGNLRLLDAEKGILHIGYFIKDDAGGRSWSADLGVPDGVLIKQVEDGVFDVSYETKTVRFVLPAALGLPLGFKLLPEEEFVTRIFDESGVKFLLIYNRRTASFYYVVNEDETPVEMTTRPVSSFAKGDKTGFIYFLDEQYQRRLLVGVSAFSVYANDHYDGPFDQVPPHLPLKEKLESAYPYVVYRGGIDEYGNFRKIEGERVAISPYSQYEDSNSLIDFFSHCSGSESKSVLWSCLAYESKKDFHKTLTPEQKALNR